MRHAWRAQHSLFIYLHRTISSSAFTSTSGILIEMRDLDAGRIQTTGMFKGAYSRGLRGLPLAGPEINWLEYITINVQSIWTNYPCGDSVDGESTSIIGSACAFQGCLWVLSKNKNRHKINKDGRQPTLLNDDSSCPHCAIGIYIHGYDISLLGLYLRL